MGIFSAICFIWIGIQIGAPIWYYVVVGCSVALGFVSAVFKGVIKYYKEQ